MECSRTFQSGLQAHGLEIILDTVSLVNHVFQKIAPAVLSPISHAIRSPRDNVSAASAMWASYHVGGYAHILCW